MKSLSKKEPKTNLFKPSFTILLAQFTLSFHSKTISFVSQESLVDNIMSFDLILLLSLSISSKQTTESTSEKSSSTQVKPPLILTCLFFVFVSYQQHCINPLTSS